jgi:O-antigen/teichoic acid export membrane protein
MSREVLKGSFTLASADFSKRALLAVTVLLCARFLSARSFGDYIFLLSFYQIFAVLAAAGLPSSLLRVVARGGQGGVHLGLASLLARLVYIVPATLSMLFVTRLMGFWRDYSWALGMLAILMFVRGAAENISFIFQGREDQLSAAKIGVMQSAVTLLLTLGICFSSKSVPQLIGAHVIGGLVSAIYGFSLLRSGASGIQAPGETLISQTRSLLQGSHWLNAGASVASAYNRVDVLLLRRLLTAEAVAVYSVPYRILDLTQIVPSSLTSAILPRLCRDREQASSGLTHPKSAIRFLLVAALLLVVLVTVAAPRITLLLFGAKYYGSIPVLQILIWATIPMFWNFVLNAQLISNSVDRAILQGAGIALAVNVGLNLLLIPKFGYMACAVVTIVTECALLTANLSFVSKVKAAAWPEDLGRLMITVAAVAGFCFCWTQAPAGYGYSLLSAGLLVTALFSVPLFKRDFALATSSPGQPNSSAARLIG